MMPFPTPKRFPRVRTTFIVGESGDLPRGHAALGDHLVVAVVDFDQHHPDFADGRKQLLEKALSLFSRLVEAMLAKDLGS